VLLDVLHEAADAHEAGTIVELPFEWGGDLRQRQLRKEAK
jgi:hypothetical protein